MSDELEQVEVEDVEEPGEQPDWIAKLRKANKADKARIRELSGQVEDLEARLADAEPKALRGTIMEAGFSPDGPAGKLLAKGLADGEVESDPTSLIEYARGYGISLTDRETIAVHGAQQLANLHAVTTSMPAPSLDDDIAEAEASGNVELSRMLKSQKLAGALEKG